MSDWNGNDDAPMIVTYRRKLQVSMTELTLLRAEQTALAALRGDARCPAEAAIATLGRRAGRARAPVDYILLHLECLRLSRTLRRTIRGMAA